MKTKALKSRELQWLEQVGQKELDAETSAAINAKKIWLDDEPLYIRTRIVGAGEIELLTSKLDEAVGITNIDKKTLPKFVNFILSAIQFGYGAVVVATNAAAEDVNYSYLQNDVPVALRHANLVVKQNDKPIYTIQIKELLQQEKAREFQGDQAYQLDYPRIIKAGVPFQIAIKFPEGKQLESVINHHFVEVFLKGARTRLK